LIVGTGQSLGQQPGNIVKVEAVYSFASGPLVDDYADVMLYYRATTPRSPAPRSAARGSALRARPTRAS
jgi:hypothetical protein